MSAKHLFSEVSGVVLADGQAVAGAVLNRTWFWHWKDQRGADATVTGPDGRFQFPAVQGRSISASLLPHEPVIEQRITIDVNGQTYKAWVHIRGSYLPNKEVGGRPLRLVCRLDTAPRAHDGYYGICELE